MMLQRRLQDVLPARQSGGIGKGIQKRQRVRSTERPDVQTTSTMKISPVLSTGTLCIFISFEQQFHSEPWIFPSEKLC